MSHHTCYATKTKAHPVASIGPVNLLTHTNKLFGKVWDGWEENDGANMLVENDGKMMLVHSSGNLDDFTVGDTLTLCHDQTRRPIGSSLYYWTVKAKAVHNAAGLRQLAELAGKKSIVMATFK